MQQGKAILLERIHCLKIADASPAGWDTVTEYLASPIAIDDEDDRRIKRAEKIAQEKQKERAEAKKSSQRKAASSPYYRPNKPFGYDQPPTEAANLPELMDFKPRFAPHMPQAQVPAFRPTGPPKGLSNYNQGGFLPVYPRSLPPSDTYYYCGLRGHWADSCPERKNFIKKCKLHSW